ncbi:MULTISPECIES: hypothetical protein [Comamonas]|uniref:hypothetical protein n=1 Tax=Comamonas TaxID=283 RepID=UPI00237E7E12|nr:hypothetical protein [Comamonas aquatica]MDE1555429.1 hypothetical protein [Comamonas aquatica]
MHAEQGLGGKWPLFAKISEIFLKIPAGGSDNPNMAHKTPFIAKHSTPFKGISPWP